MTDIRTTANNCIISPNFLTMPVRFLVAVAPLLLMLGACGESDDTSSSDTTLSTASEVAQVTFDGSECVYSGPEEVTTGAVTIELINNTDNTVGLSVGSIGEGKTIEDAFDDWGVDMPKIGGKPNWITDTGWQPWAQPGETMEWEANLAAGPHIAICGTTEPTRAGWWGGGFTVVDG